MNRNIIARAVEHALAAAVLMVVPSLLLGQAIWRAEYSILLILGLFAALYFLCAIGLLLSGASEAQGRWWRILLAGLAAFGAGFMLQAAAIWKWPTFFGDELPVVVPLASSVLGVFLLVALLCIRGAFVWKALALGSALLGGLVLQYQGSEAPTREVAYVDSSLYVLKATTYRNRVSDDGISGGAIAAFGTGYLLVGGDGQLSLVSENDGGSALDVQQLAYRVPINRDEFVRDAREILARASLEADVFLGLRVSDIQVQQRPDDSFRLFVSHHHWDGKTSCVTVRVSVLEGRRRELLDPSGALEWRTRYDSGACLKLNVDGNRGVRFAALQMGGAMAFLGENDLLLTLGDHEFDGWTREPALPQDPDSPYGKVMLIHIDSGQAEVYSTGHRNPQGLYVDSGGNIWSTEHGPKGGDELNRIVRGANYGWPGVTYGTDYQLHRWPLNSIPGRHDGFEKPVLAFVPSIAVSALTGISGSAFQAWAGDLLIISLSGELRRIRIEDGHVVLAEPITLGNRVRDVVQGTDGRILLWTDGNDLIFVEPAAADSGETLVFQCTGCHALDKHDHSSIGPNLYQLAGRRVGSRSDFNYSKAMQQFGGRWTRERLDQFLEDPARTVPGTTMKFAGMSDARSESSSSIISSDPGARMQPRVRQGLSAKESRLRGRQSPWTPVRRQMRG